MLLARIVHTCHSWQKEAKPKGCRLGVMMCLLNGSGAELSLSHQNTHTEP